MIKIEEISKEEILMYLQYAREEADYRQELIEKMSKEIKQLKKQLEVRKEEVKKEEKKLSIIEKGTKIPPDKQIYVTRCRFCGCKFTYKFEDIHYERLQERTYVICPECGYSKYPFINRKYKGDKK